MFEDHRKHDDDVNIWSVQRTPTLVVQHCALHYSPIGFAAITMTVTFRQAHRDLTPRQQLIAGTAHPKAVRNQKEK